VSILEGWPTGKAAAR